MRFHSASPLIPAPHLTFASWRKGSSEASLSYDLQPPATFNLAAPRARPALRAPERPRGRSRWSRDTGHQRGDRCAGAGKRVDANEREKPGVLRDAHRDADRRRAVRGDCEPTVACGREVAGGRRDGPLPVDREGARRVRARYVDTRRAGPGGLLRYRGRVLVTRQLGAAVDHDAGHGYQHSKQHDNHERQAAALIVPPVALHGSHLLHTSAGAVSVERARETGAQAGGTGKPGQRQAREGDGAAHHCRDGRRLADRNGRELARVDLHDRAAIEPVLEYRGAGADEPGRLGGRWCQRDRRLPGRVTGRRVHRALRDGGAASRDHQAQQSEQDRGQDDQFERSVALIGTTRARAAPARTGRDAGTAHGRNSSAGACAVADTFTTRPGTKLGTWPLTVIDTVLLVLPSAVARGSSR